MKMEQETIVNLGSTFCAKTSAVALLACASMVLTVGCSGTSDEVEDDDMAISEADLGTDMATNNDDPDMGTVDEPDMPMEEPDMPEEDSTVTMTATFLDHVSGEVLGGAEVCVLDAEPQNCAETDAAGQVQMEVPGGAEVALTATLADYYPSLYPVTLPDEDFEFPRMTLTTEANAFGLLGLLGITQDPANGGMAITIQGAGVTPVLEPDAGDDPWYLVGTDISQSDTGTPGVTSAAGISNIPPGEYVVTFEHDTKVCQTVGVWPGEAPNQQRILIRAGFLSGLASLDCL